MYFEPFVGSHFSFERLIVYAVIEDLSAPARHAAQAGFAQGSECVVKTQARDA